jgi:hypothetical protein
MGCCFLSFAHKLGYRAAYFNLVFASNVASVRLWEALGFTRAAAIPQAARLKGIGVAGFLDTAYGYHFDLEKLTGTETYDPLAHAARVIGKSAAAKQQACADPGGAGRRHSAQATLVRVPKDVALTDVAHATKTHVMKPTLVYWYACTFRENMAEFPSPPCNSFNRDMRGLGQAIRMTLEHFTCSPSDVNDHDYPG